MNDRFLADAVLPIANINRGESCRDRSNNTLNNGLAMGSSHEYAPTTTPVAVALRWSVKANRILQA